MNFKGEKKANGSSKWHPKEVNRVGFIDWLKSGILIIADTILEAGETIIKGVRSVLGLEKRPPREKIRAALRQQWLSLAPGEKEIPGVEWEDEVYYETPK